MTENPNEIVVATLQVVVMPNGEVICLGKTVGWVDKLGPYLRKNKTIHAPKEKLSNALNNIKIRPTKQSNTYKRSKIIILRKILIFLSHFNQLLLYEVISSLGDLPSISDCARERPLTVFFPRTTSPLLFRRLQRNSTPLEFTLEKSRLESSLYTNRRVKNALSTIIAMEMWPISGIERHSTTKIRSLEIVSGIARF